MSHLSGGFFLRGAFSIKQFCNTNTKSKWKINEKPLRKISQTLHRGLIQDYFNLMWQRFVPLDSLRRKQKILRHRPRTSSRGHLQQFLRRHKSP